MKQIDPMVFVAVFQEMLGLAFWPLAGFILLMVVAVVLTVVREGRISPRRLVYAQGIGAFGGVLAVWAMLWFTSSRATDLLGGPIDWLLTLAIAAAGVIGGAMIVYVALSFAPASARRGPAR